jgi:hypothetical protein
MTKKIFILVIFLLGNVHALAQHVDTAWVRRYNGPGNRNDDARAITVDRFGNVYITGPSGYANDDYATIKYYTNGDTAWVRRYNGPGNSFDYATAIAVDGSGNVYVTGESQGSATASAYATIKYYPNGDTAWVRRYNGPANKSDWAFALAVDGLGNVYVTGYSEDTLTSFDYATIKYDSDGTLLWVSRYNGPGDDLDVAYDIIVDGLGNVYVTGYSGGNGSSEDYATIKYYANGDTAWVRRYNGLGNGGDYASAITVDHSGNVFVTGYSWGIGTYRDYTTLKYDSSGNELWVRRYDGPGSNVDYAWAMTLDSYNNIYVTGVSRGSVTSADYATIKYYPNGDTAWVRRYNGLGNGYDYAVDLAVDSSGNVYITGESDGIGTYRDYVTIKYDTIGTEKWVTRYNGPKNYNDYAHSIAVDDSGNVYVTGQSAEISGVYYDYVTIKYIQIQNYPPNSFSLLSPSDSAIVPYVVSFNWQTATDPDPWDTAEYDLYVSTSSNFHLDSTIIYDSLLTTEYPDTLEIGKYYWKVRAYDNHSEVWSTQTWTFISVMRGDANADKRVTVSDIVFLINYLFKDGPSPNPFPLEQGDVNCNGHITVSDVIYLINYLFKGGDPPCS